MGERVKSNINATSVCRFRSLKAVSRVVLVTFSLFSTVVYAVSPAGGDEYQFDQNLMFGVGSLARFNKVDAINPGQYTVEVYLNKNFVQRLDIRFYEASDSTVQPCLSLALLENAGVLHSAIQLGASADCLVLAEAVKGASFTFDVGNLRLDLRVPQSLINRTPRGYVPVESLDSGETIGFLNYNLNHYHVTRSGPYSSQLDSSYAVLNGGINMGLWRLRQQGTVRDDAQGLNWQSTRLYLQRAVPSLQSELMLGEGYTSGQFFSGVGFRGVEIGSDDRMLPESIRGYAPTVRGIAQTNAQVSIRQNGNEIYQTVVPPGPFEISDLYATQYNGDLQVSVQEADGRVSRFTVPFSAVAESLRPGASRYRYALGRTQNTGHDIAFSELTYQRGLSNAVTVNSGLRYAQNYQAALIGGVYANWLGAFGLDTTYSRADVAGQGAIDGWMSRLSYSRTFVPTHTLLSVAGYHYFTPGYRDFTDVLDAYSFYNVDQGGVSRYWPRSRLDVSVNQSLDTFGSIYLSASTQSYRGGHAPDTQLQMGYGQTFKAVSFNVSVARQTTGPSQQGAGRYTSVAEGSAINTDYTQSVRIPGTTETLVLISVSLPLGSPSNPQAPTFSSSISHSANFGDVYQSELSGVTGADQSLNYGVSIAHDASQAQNTFSGNLQKRLPTGALGVSASQGPDYWQASGTARGALAVHRGGVTLGPYLGDTFALVQAKGANGAKIMNGQGTQIDAAGFALVPSLTPYRYNTVAINPEGMEENAELEEGQRRVAPFAGAAVKINFKTRTGTALLIRARLANGQVIPMGADVIDEQGSVVGMVGQGSQAYVRSEQLSGHLTLRWGEESDDRCVITYDLHSLDLKQPLIQLDQECRTPKEAP